MHHESLSTRTHSVPLRRFVHCVFCFIILASESATVYNDSHSFLRPYALPTSFAVATEHLVSLQIPSSSVLNPAY